MGSTVLKTVATTHSPLDGQSCKSERITWKYSEKYMLWHSRRRGVEKHSCSTPTEHGDQKEKRSARSMGITVWVFSTTLARERPFCNSYLTRTSARSLVPREPKWRYDRKHVAKGRKGTNAWRNSRSPCSCKCYENH